jgi:hypothetical protein
MSSIAPEKLRAWYAHRQGLDGSLHGKSPAQVLERSGWSRSVGGVGPYFTIFSRAGTSREEVDDAVAKQEISELPAARHCTYVLPASEFALGLKVGQGFLSAEMRVGLKLGVTEKEIDKLCDAVLVALTKAQLSPDELRAATGDASRSLGEAGKKKGLSTTLPLALGRLQAHGEIRRVPVNGRLDQQRYRYAAWRPNPLANFKLTDNAAFTELARKFFSWAGPATISQFQEFCGLGVKAAVASLEPLKLKAMGEKWILPQDLEAFESFSPPPTARYAVTSSLDSILFSGGVKNLLDPADAARPFWNNKAGVPSHLILDRGRIIGLWEYDPTTESIAWTSFIKKNRDLETAVARAENYVRDQLGDARAFSLDSPASRVSRISALRGN